MRVVNVINSIDQSSGGPARSVPLACEGVSQLGVVIILCSKPCKKVVEITRNKNLEVLFFGFVQLLWKGLLISKKNISIIHLQHIWTPYIHAMALIARIKGVPTIITPRGMLDPWIMARHPWKKHLAMWLYQKKDLDKAACIHVTSQMEKTHVRALGFKNPIAVIPNGIDLAAIPSRKRQFGAKKVVFLSRLHQKKGIEVLFDAWRKVDTTGWVLEIAGEGDAKYVESLKDRLQLFELNNVKFVGPQYGNDKWDFLYSADVLVLPTFSENFGNVVVEALAIGLPVITTQGTPWQELETEQCGWWIDLSADNLANAIESAMTKSPSELEAMGKRGQRLIETQYDIGSVAPKLKELYEWIGNEDQIPDFVDFIE